MTDVLHDVWVYLMKWPFLWQIYTTLISSSEYVSFSSPIWCILTPEEHNYIHTKVCGITSFMDFPVPLLLSTTRRHLLRDVIPMVRCHVINPDSFSMLICHTFTPLHNYYYPKHHTLTYSLTTTYPLHGYWQHVFVTCIRNHLHSTVMSKMLQYFASLSDLQSWNPYSASSFFHSCHHITLIIFGISTQ